jgi:hypothetical protein
MSRLESLEKTVGADIDGGVVHLQYGVARRRKSARGTEWIKTDIVAAPRDEMIMLADGIRAISPDRVDGLVGAVAAFLPQQRGLTVQPIPQVRERNGVHQVGLTLEAGPIGLAYQASATFWSPGSASTTAGNAHGDLDQLEALLEPAATWIAIYLVSNSMSVHPSRWHPLRTIARGSPSAQLEGEATALRSLLAAQLASYEMSWYAKEEPLVCLGFSEQALDDIHRATAILKGYFRPHYIAGTIHELRGDALLALSTTSGRRYAEQARKSFDQASKESGVALEMLNEKACELYREADGQDNERVTQLRPEYQIRSLKAALRGSDPNGALNRVSTADITWSNVDQHYNWVCLCAIAATAARELHRDDHEFASLARDEFVAVLRKSPDFEEMVESDPELSAAFTQYEIRKRMRYALPRR